MGTTQAFRVRFGRDESRPLASRRRSTPACAHGIRQFGRTAVWPSKHLKPLAGYLAPSCPKISEAEYIALVDWTGRQWHPEKRGKIANAEPPALRRLGTLHIRKTSQPDPEAKAIYAAMGFADKPGAIKRRHCRPERDLRAAQTVV